MTNRSISACKLSFFDLVLNRLHTALGDLYIITWKRSNRSGAVFCCQGTFHVGYQCASAVQVSLGFVCTDSFWKSLSLSNLMFTSEIHHAAVPSLLHFAAQYGFKSVSSLLLQCPGAERALHTANRHGQTPTEIAKSNGHTQLHILLRETLVNTFSSTPFLVSVHLFYVQSSFWAFPPSSSRNTPSYQVK